MKNVLFWTILTILLLGIVSLHFRYTRGGVENWQLANFPFPGAGLSVAEIFHIENGGIFCLELSVPEIGEIPIGIPPKPPIKSRLKITIIGKNGNNFKDTRYIEEFKSSGGGGYSRTFFYTSATIELPRRGDYKIEIINEDHDEIFENCSKTGGMIRLVRNYKQTTETHLRYLLLHVFSYALIIISIIGMVIFGITTNFKSN